MASGGMDRNQRENVTTQRLEKDGRPKIESLLRKTQTILKIEKLARTLAFMV